MCRTHQNAEEPELTFDMEQMVTFPQNLQQAAGSSSQRPDRCILLRDFKEQDPSSFDGNPNLIIAQL